MLWRHPGVAQIDCEDCCRRLYDLETGKPKTFTKGRQKETAYYWFEGEPQPPCRTGATCPKESPEKSHLHELTPRNWQTLEMWKRYRVAPHEYQGRLDELAIAAFAVLEDLKDQIDEYRRGEQLRIAVKLASHG